MNPDNMCHETALQVLIAGLVPDLNSNNQQSP